MHSSRMHTTHFVTVSQHALCRGGGVFQHALGGGRGSGQRGCLPGGGCLPGVYGRHSHPPEPEADTPHVQNDRQV